MLALSRRNVAALAAHAIVVRHGATFADQVDTDPLKPPERG